MRAISIAAIALAACTVAWVCRYRGSAVEAPPCRAAGALPHNEVVGAPPASASDASVARSYDPLIAPLTFAEFQVESSAAPPGGQPTSPSGLAASGEEFGHDPTAAFHPHGEQVCASGCAVSRHPTQSLTTAHFHQLLARCAGEPMDETGEALETLLYYGRQARRLLQSTGAGPLDGRRASLLRRELSRTHVRVSVRVMDARGMERAWLAPSRVPLDRRHVFALKTRDIQPLVVSGTVKRVGLHHLWTRL